MKSEQRDRNAPPCDVGNVTRRGLRLLLGDCERDLLVSRSKV